MESKITVDKAVNAFYFRVLIPFFITLFSSIGILVYLGIRYFSETIGVIGGFAFGFLMAFLIFFRLNVAYVIWSYRRIDNLKEFEIRYPKLFPLNKLWLATAQEKETLKDLKQHLKSQKPISGTTQYEQSKIYYSRVSGSMKIVLLIAFFAFCFITGIPQIMQSENNFALGALIVAFLFLLFQAYIGFKHIMTSDPVLVISEQGIETLKNGFQEWSNIFNFNITTGKYSKIIITYKEPGLTAGKKEKESYKISELKISADKLEYLMQKYWNQYKKIDI